MRMRYMRDIMRGIGAVTVYTLDAHARRDVMQVSRCTRETRMRYMRIATGSTLHAHARRDVMQVRRRDTLDTQAAGRLFRV
jgi:hypothetical protein